MPTLILATIFMPSAQVYEEINALALICHPMDVCVQRRPGTTLAQCYL